MSLYPHVCDIDAEPLHRYTKGEYHPVHLNDVLKEGRYKILHKLGWGGYSTVWACRDKKEHTYVAMKIAVSEVANEDREFKVSRALTGSDPTRTQSHHIMRLLDQFQHEGPNGRHQCLVLELLGPTVTDVLDGHYNDDRLPGDLAKRVAREAFLGLAYMHEREVCHGDLHIRNLAFALPSLHNLVEPEFVDTLGMPETSPVKRMDNRPRESGMPKNIVRPTSFRITKSSTEQPIKIVDFGESFLKDDAPDTLHTPLAVRAPEVIFGDTLDYRVDLWSAGCMIFELITGQPPVDSIMATPTSVARQMFGVASDDLPDRWWQKWRDMDEADPGDPDTSTLQGWLEEVYFDDARRQDLSKDDIRKIGHLISRLLRFEPSTRASAKEILDDPWFKTQ